MCLLTLSADVVQQNNGAAASSKRSGSTHDLTCHAAGGDPTPGVLNSSGELGDGTYGGSATPVKVAGNHTFVLIGDMLDDHMCAIATRQASPGQSR